MLEDFAKRFDVLWVVGDGCGNVCRYGRYYVKQYSWSFSLMLQKH